MPASSSSDSPALSRAAVASTLKLLVVAPTASSNSGGGVSAVSDAKSTREPAKATAADPYGRPKRSGASRAVMSLTCSGVSPPRGIRNSVRVRVCGRGAEIEWRDIIEGEDNAALPADDARVRMPRSANKLDREALLGVIGRLAEVCSVEASVCADPLRACVAGAAVRGLEVFVEVVGVCELNGYKRKPKRERRVPGAS